MPKIPVAFLFCAAVLVNGQAVESKTAEQVYKNIVELKGTPADQLGPAMQFIAASLGVECSFCHVPGKMDLDEKPAKKTAREMMEMTAAINKNAFKGRMQVTCYSCHRGSTHPVNLPPVLESDAAPKPDAARPPASPATVDQIIDKYIAAMGGAEAIGKITSRIETGKILAGGKETPIEVITKAPNRRVTITHGANGDSYTAFDGTAGWMGNAGRPAREMSPAESSASALDGEFALALHLKDIYPMMRHGRPEMVDGVECEVLQGTAPGHPAVRLDFDAQSGLLVRMVRYAQTPMGRNTTQIDYADYRESDGVKIPFRWTLSRPNGRFTIQIAEVKSNVPVDDAKFVKPAGEIK